MVYKGPGAMKIDYYKSKLSEKIRQCQSTRNTEDHYHPSVPFFSERKGAVWVTSDGSIRVKPEDEGGRGEASLSCVPLRLRELLRQEKESTKKQDEIILPLTRISPCSSSDQDVPIFKGAKRVCAPVQKNIQTPVYRPPEASLPLPDLSDPVGMGSSYLCRAPVKFLQKAIHRKSDPRLAAKKVENDRKILQTFSLSDLQSYADVSNCSDEVTPPHRNHAPTSMNYEQIPSTSSRQIRLDFARTRNAKLPEFSYEQSPVRSQRSDPIFDPSFGDFPNWDLSLNGQNQYNNLSWQPRSSFDESGEAVSDPFHEYSFEDSYYKDEETYARETLSRQLLLQDNSGSPRAISTSSSMSNVTLSMPARLTTDMLKQHEQKSSRVKQAPPTYEGDQLAKAVIKNKHVYEHIKENKLRAKEEKQHLAKKAPIKERAKQQLKRVLPTMMTSPAQKGACGTASMTDPQGIVWDVDDMKRVDKEEMKAYEARHNWLEMERQSSLSAKWQQKRRERIDQSRIEEMRLAQIERRRQANIPGRACTRKYSI